MKRARSKAPSPKKKITLYFPEALLEEARSAVLALGVKGDQPGTLSQLFGEALENELQKLRDRLNDGEPFPPYKSRLPGGRPASLLLEDRADLEAAREALAESDERIPYEEARRRLGLE